MLEFLRRQTKPIMITLAVIIIIAFTFWGGSMKTGSRAQQMHSEDDTAFTIYGKEYSFADKARIERHLELARSMQMYNFMQTLMQANQKYMLNDRSMPLDLSLNLIVLEKELDKNGIRASDAEAKAEFKKLPAFRNQTTGEFDVSQAEAFEKNLGSYGMNQHDVLDLLRNWIGLRKLQKLVSGNYVESNFIVSKFYAATYETIKASSIVFPLESFKKTAQVSDEEIKKYYEQKKDEFKTSEKRAVSYVFIEKPKTDEKKDDKTPAPSDEERRKKENDFTKKVTDFATAAVEKDAKITSVAKDEKFKLEVKAVPAFSGDAPPEALKDESSLLSEIFHNDSKTHPISDAVEGKNGYYFFSVTSVEEPKQQEQKEVEPKIKETLVAQKAKEAMTKAANDARKAIEEAVKGGKKFEDAVKEQKLEVKALPEFSPSEPPKDLDQGRMIAGYTEKTPAGKFTDPLPSETGVTLIYVNSKELRKRDDSAAKKAELAEGFTEYSQGTLFKAWFERRKTEAKIDANPVVQRASKVRSES